MNPPQGSGSGGGGGSTSAPPAPPSGLELARAGAASILVRAGRAMDSTRAVALVLAADTAADLTSNGTAAGWDRKTLTGTTAVSNGAATLAGTGTAYRTEFGARTLTGTISTSGPSTTITGTGTRFTREVAINDLVCGGSGTFTRVVAIVDDVTLTVGTAVTIAAGAAATLIEQPFVQSGTEVRRLATITSDTAATVTANWGAGAASGTAYAGARPTATYQVWANLFLISDGSTVSVYASTQRTTPLALPSGYMTYAHLGAVVLTTAGAVPAFTFARRGWCYEVRQEDDGSNRTIRFVDGGTDTTATRVDLSAAVPPGAVAAFLRSQVGGGGGGGQALYYLASTANGTYTRRQSVAAVNIQSLPTSVPVVAQAVAYYVDAGGTAYVDADGYDAEVTR